MSIGKYLAVLGLVACVAASGGAWAGLSDGLVGYWSFDQSNAKDDTGLQSTGTIQGGVTFVQGKNGMAAKFGGVGNPGHIRIPNSASMQFTTGATFAFWGRIDDWKGMDGNGQTVTPGWPTWFAKSHDRTGFAFRSSLGASGTWAGVATYESWGGGMTPTNNIASGETGKWHHFVLMLSSADGTKVYVDGALEGTSSIPVNFATTNGQDLYLGKYSDSWYPLNGMIDDFRIYNRALSAAEIQQLASGSTGTCDTTTPYNQGYAAAQAACKASPSSCGITVSTSGSGVTTGNHATYNPTANTVHIPYLDVSLLGATSVYEVDLTVMPNTNPLQLKLQNAKQVP